MKTADETRPKSGGSSWSLCTWCWSTMCRKLSWCHRFSTLPCVMQRLISPNYKYVQKLWIFEVNRWSGQCSCRGAEAPSHHSKQKKLSASLNFVLSVVFLFQKMNFFFLKILWNTFLSFLLTKMFFACALCS